MTIPKLPTPEQVKAELTAEEGCRIVKTGKYPSWVHFYNLCQHVFTLEETVRQQNQRIKDLEDAYQNMSECWDSANQAITQMTNNMEVMASALEKQGLIYFKDAANDLH